MFAGCGDRGCRPIVGDGAQGLAPWTPLCGRGSIDDLIQGFRSGRLDPAGRAEEALAAARDARARNVFIHLDAEEVRRSAESSAKRFRTGAATRLLEGVPIAWKDVFERRGEVLKAGSRIERVWVTADRTAPIVQAMTLHGAVFFGRTNLSELALGGLGLNPHYGTPANAAAQGQCRVPGGSSSGSATAVALGLVPAAVGTDTSGSIRVPAAFNGIVGFRPSKGRYPSGGTFILAPSLDTIGLLAACVQDIALLDGIASGDGGARCASDVLVRPDLVVPDNFVFDSLDPLVARQFESALRSLSRHGHAIRHRTLESFDLLNDAIACHGTLVVAEAYRRYGMLLRGPNAELMDPNVQRRLASGAEIDDTALAELRRVCRVAQRLMASELGDAVLTFPTVPITAPEIGPLEDDPDLLFRTNSLVLRNTMLGSLLDTPAISLPVGTGAGGLTIGLQLSMSRGRDRQLLTVAAAAERTLAPLNI